MKLLLAVLLVLLPCVGSDVEPQIVYYEAVTPDDAPGIEVQFYVPVRSADQFRVYLDYNSETGRKTTMSKLIDTKARSRSSVTLFSVLFETGICRVTGIRIEELTPAKTYTRAY